MRALRTMDYHELTALLPHPEPDDNFLADIKANGLIHDIQTYEGKILDGRKRHLACLREGVEPRYSPYEGSLSPWLLLKSNQLCRAHYPPDQRVAILLALAQRFPEVQASIDSVRAAGRARARGEAIGTKGKTSAHIGSLAGNAGTRTAERVLKVQRESQPLFKDIVSGLRNVNQALRELSNRNIPLPLPKDKFSVVYADPPWQYSGISHAGFAKPCDHYKTMKLSVIEAMAVKDISADNAVLFLWCPGLLLPQALRVMSGWGFTYKHYFAWHKPNYLPSPYGGWRHETLLLGIRGRFLPVWQCDDSIIRVEKDSQRHSAKPAYWRDMIDRMYPRGKRIELFARNPSPGWSVWGNQV